MDWQQRNMPARPEPPLPGPEASFLALGELEVVVAEKPGQIALEIELFALTFAKVKLSSLRLNFFLWWGWGGGGVWVGEGEGMYDRCGMKHMDPSTL